MTDEEIIASARMDAEACADLVRDVRAGTERPERDTVALLLALDDDWRADRQGVDWEAASYEARRNYRVQADLVMGGWA